MTPPIFYVNIQLQQRERQPYPVVNGYINKSASATDLQAAKEALQGSDPTNGALFYFDDSTTNQWLRSKKVALKDGKMIFSY